MLRPIIRYTVEPPPPLQEHPLETRRVRVFVKRTGTRVDPETLKSELENAILEHLTPEERDRQFDEIVEDYLDIFNAHHSRIDSGYARVYVRLELSWDGIGEKR